MKKVVLALFAIATALAFSPVASAQTWDFTFTSGSVVATGTLTGNLVAPGEYQITSGTIDLTGSTMNGTGVLVPSLNSNGNFYTGGGTILTFSSPWDFDLYPNQNPQIDNNGVLLFSLGGFNTYNGSGPGNGLAIWSNGPGNYGGFGGNWTVNDLAGGAGFSTTLVPEGGATLLYLLIAGMACFGAIRLGLRDQHGIRMA